MRELVMRKWCDACYADGEIQEPATTTYTIGAVSGETRPALRVVELCERHDKVATDLIHLLSGIGQLPDFAQKTQKPLSAINEGKQGRPFTSAENAARTMPCPICDIGIVRSAMINHVWSQHRTDPKPVYGTTCPDCRAEYDTGQGVAAHRRSEHGFDALADALSGAKGYHP